MTDLVTCPCCGYRTLPDGPGAYELCEICDWEDDGVSTHEPLVWDGNPNGVSLAEAQRRFQRYGSTSPDGPWSRAPRPVDARDPEWEPAVDPSASAYDDYVRDLAFLVVQAAHQARDEVRRTGDERAQGRAEAWQEAARLLVRQAAAFGLSIEDPELSYAADPPPPDATPSDGRHAG